MVVISYILDRLVRNRRASIRALRYSATDLNLPMRIVSDEHSPRSDTKQWGIMELPAVTSATAKGDTKRTGISAFWISGVGTCVKSGTLTDARHTQSSTYREKRMIIQHLKN